MSEKFSFDKPQNIIIAVLAIAVIALGYLQFSGTVVSGQVSGDKAAQDALAFINKNLIQPGSPEAQMQGEVMQESGLYKFNVKVGEREFPLYVSRDASLLFAQNPINIKPATTSAATTTDDQNPPVAEQGTIGDFSVKADKEVCLENGKPVVYFFGSESCPHCVWEKPIIKAVADKFSGVISFHNNVDNNTDMDIFSQYSDGGIPTLVMGCKYYRVGSGEASGEAAETQALTALMCKLTAGQPGEVCSEVADLVSQIQ